jgi:glycosyltransferase involved in cell wall biosynthesis
MNYIRLGSDEADMSKIRVIYIDFNFKDEKYPNRKHNGDSWFTYGFGSIYARKFKQHYPDFDVECWKADCFAKKQDEKTIENVLFRIFPAFDAGRGLGFYSSSLLKKLKEEAGKNKNTIINCSSFDHLLFFSICLSSHKLPVVVQHHGESPARLKVNSNKGLKSTLLKLKLFLESLALKKTSLLYLLDPEAKQWLAGQPQKTRVLTTGVDQELFKPIAKKEARIKLGLPPDREYLLYVGKLNSTKKPEWLIDLYNELRFSFSNLDLIIGGCSVNDPLYEKAQKSGALIKGVIPQSEMSLWLSAASIYYLPGLSDHHKFGGIGMLPVQAMFCNTPVIGGTLKCLPENLKGKVGIYTKDFSELKEATIKIINKEIVFEKIRELVLQEYSWEAISKKTANDYYEIIHHYSNR